MDTHTSTFEHRLSQLERSSNRWRFATISICALFAGIMIGGMNTSHESSQSEKAPKDVVGVAGTRDRIIRVHRDGSLSYLQIPGGDRTSQGYFNWGEIKIDTTRKSRSIPQ